MAALIEEAVRLVKAANRVAVAGHVKPDGDAIGSLLAMGRLLAWLGKQTVLLCDDSVPRRYRFLPGSGAVRSDLNGFEPDLLIGVDTNDAPRLGKAGLALLEAGLPTLNLDHHVTNDNFGTLNWVNPAWVATAEGVLEFLDALGAPLDEETAICLLTGLATDTRGFRTANVTAKSLQTASRLMEAGADLPGIMALTLDSRSLPELQVLGAGLTNLQMEDGAIWTAVPLLKPRTDVATTGLPSMLLGADGAKVSAVFRERSDGKVEISFRAAPGFDVAVVAMAMGGGGHVLAAGATIDGPLEAAVEQVVPVLKQATRPQAVLDTASDGTPQD